jgi:uncharacterized metal-binding protein
MWMPGFTGHAIGNTIALLGTTAYMWSDHWSVPDIIAVDAGILISTIVLSPDMDLFTSRSMEDWGVMKVFWWPYARIVKHRDRLHTPILGTSVRWIYTLLVFSVFVTLISLLFRQAGIKVSLNYTGGYDSTLDNLLYVLDVFIGANIADAVHFGLDIFTHGLKHGGGHLHFPSQGGWG